jgi:hypothetical protein
MSDEKKHIINLSRNGTFQQSGLFNTTPEDVDGIFTDFENSGASYAVISRWATVVSERTPPAACYRIPMAYRCSSSEVGLEGLGDNLVSIANDPIQNQFGIQIAGSSPADGVGLTL